MAKIRKLTQAERGQIILLHLQNVTLAAIAQKMKCSRCAVRAAIKRYQETGLFTNRRKSSRKCSTAARQYRLLERISLRDRKKNAKRPARFW